MVLKEFSDDLDKFVNDLFKSFIRVAQKMCLGMFTINLFLYVVLGSDTAFRKMKIEIIILVLMHTMEIHCNKVRFHFLVYLFYFLIQIGCFEVSLHVSGFSKKMMMGIAVQFQNMLHQFSLFDIRYKLVITILTVIYQAARFNS